MVRPATSARSARPSSAWPPRWSRKTSSAASASTSGCIPTKALLHSAYVANLVAHDAKDLGIEVGGVKTDYGVAMKRSRQVSEQNSKGVEFLMKKHKVTVLKGTGVLRDGPHGARWATTPTRRGRPS